MHTPVFCPICRKYWRLEDASPKLQARVTKMGRLTCAPCALALDHEESGKVEYDAVVARESSAISPYRMAMLEPATEAVERFSQIYTKKRGNGAVSKVEKKRRYVDFFGRERGT